MPYFEPSTQSDFFLLGSTFQKNLTLALVPVISFVNFLLLLTNKTGSVPYLTPSRAHGTAICVTFPQPEHATRGTSACR